MDFVICKDCLYLRTNLPVVSEFAIAVYHGKTVYPCNRYPQNILRHPDELACGEFQKKD